MTTPMERSSMVTPDDHAPCITCDGQGYFTVEAGHPGNLSAFQETYVECADCQGSGHDPECAGCKAEAT